MRVPRPGLRPVVFGWTFVAIVFGLSAVVAPSGAAAHGTPEDAVYHSLIVLVGLPDAGLAPGEQLCVALFSGADTDLATPLQTQCLLPGAASAGFDGLGHGGFRVVVPAPGSVLGDDRYEGRVAETDVPNDPEIDAYVVEVPVALTGDVAGTTGTIDVNAFVCAAGSAGGAEAAAWAEACPNRAGGVSFSLESDGDLSGTTLNALTDPGGDASFADLAAGQYVLTEAPLDNVVPDAEWFVTSSYDGITVAVAPGTTVSVRPGEVLMVDVYHLLVAPAAVPTGPDPVTEPTTPVTPVTSAAGTGPATPTGSRPTAVDTGVGALVSTGGDVESGIGDGTTGDPDQPLVTVLPSTGAGTDITDGRGRNVVANRWLGCLAVATLAVTAWIGRRHAWRRGQVGVDDNEGRLHPS